MRPRHRVTRQPAAGAARVAGWGNLWRTSRRCGRARPSAACGWGPACPRSGSQLTLVAVSLEVYRLTQDSLYVGLLSIFALVPLVFGGLLGGSIADAHDRRTVALLASVGALAGHRLPGAAGLAAAGQCVVLYVLVAVQSGAQAINQPARSAIIPVLVRKELLPAANALSMIEFGLAMTAGPLLAGVLVAWIGFGWTYTIDVLSFALCVLGAAEAAADAARGSMPARPGCGPSWRASVSWAPGPTCG